MGDRRDVEVALEAMANTFLARVASSAIAEQGPNLAQPEEVSDDSTQSSCSNTMPEEPYEDPPDALPGNPLPELPAVESAAPPQQQRVAPRSKAGHQSLGSSRPPRARL